MSTWSETPASFNRTWEAVFTLAIAIGKTGNQQATLVQTMRDYQSREVESKIPLSIAEEHSYRLRKALTYLARFA